MLSYQKKSNRFTNCLLLLAALVGITSAFVPNLSLSSVGSHAHLVTPLKTSDVRNSKQVQSFLTVQRTNRRSRSLPALNLFGAETLAEAIASYGDIFVGTFVVFCATSPYVLGVVFPETMYKLMFKHVYKDEATLEAQGIAIDLPDRAEITWKNMYSSVGFFITLAAFQEANTPIRPDVTGVLRDTFLIWAIFYVLATIKLRKEDVVLKIVEGNRLPAQAWHITVATLLLFCVFTGPKAPLIEQVLSAIGK